MGTDVNAVMSMEVPLVVVLGERVVTIKDIRNWITGSIIELSKEAEEDLEVRINNRTIGFGSAVKVGENFGIKLNYVGDPAQRVEAMGPDNGSSSGDMNAEDLAAALLDGQI